VTQPLVLVDYAHTPDALAQALSALQPVAQHRGGKLLCVFGCGGDRDRSKRPLMARAAEQGADAVTLTQDNPRTEHPAQIEADALAGLADPSRVTVERDRAKAIAWTIQQAAAEDVVLIAGKGHEDYQEIMGVKHPFSDQAVARAALERKANEVFA
jgi:UDP-N-acetylmuramoyl-L-alanyl-D-glutamate--2,6-diaminopimelate ligase